MRTVRALLVWDDSLVLAEHGATGWQLMSSEVPSDATPYDALCEMLARRAGIRVLEHYGDITADGTWLVTRWQVLAPPPLGVDWVLMEQLASEPRAAEAMAQWEIHRREW